MGHRGWIDEWILLLEKETYISPLIYSIMKKIYKELWGVLTDTRFWVMNATASFPLTAMDVSPVDLTALNAYSTMIFQK